MVGHLAVALVVLMVGTSVATLGFLKAVEKVDEWAVLMVGKSAALMAGTLVVTLEFLMVVEKAQKLVAAEVEWMVCERVAVMVA